MVRVCSLIKGSWSRWWYAWEPDASTGASGNLTDGSTSNSAASDACQGLPCTKTMLFVSSPFFYVIKEGFVIRAYTVLVLVGNGALHCNPGVPSM